MRPAYFIPIWMGITISQSIVNERRRVEFRARRSTARRDAQAKIRDSNSSIHSLARSLRHAPRSRTHGRAYAATHTPLPSGVHSLTRLPLLSVPTSFLVYNRRANRPRRPNEYARSSPLVHSLLLLSMRAFFVRRIGDSRRIDAFVEKKRKGNSRKLAEAGERSLVRVPPFNEFPFFVRGFRSTAITTRFVFHPASAAGESHAITASSVF